MQTPTHLIMSTALQYPLRRFNIPLSRSGLLIGAVVPDMGLLILSAIYWHIYVQRQQRYTPDTIWEHLNTLFFTDPIWIFGHNVFHSLVIGSALLAIGWRLIQRNSSPFVFWFAASMLLHTSIDIVTHISDGPVFLFPLNWTYRFVGPVSYWESGRWFVMLEYGLNAVLLAYIGRKWLTQHKSQRQSNSTG